MARAEHTAFDALHPCVPAAYLALTVGLTMFSVQPVLIALSLAGAFAYGCCARGPASCISSLRWQIPLLLIIALVNPLFSASGSTELFRVGGRAVYLESLCYGFSMGGLFIASAMWFQAAASMLSFDKVLALLGNAAPVLALMLSMSMRMIPRFLRQGKTVAAVQGVIASSSRNAVPAAAPAGAGATGARLSDAARDGSRAAGTASSTTGSSAVRLNLRLASVLMGWAMEDSLETADAMRARGWSCGVRRTTYARFDFSGRDALALAAVAAAGALCCALAWLATSQFRFYPTMSELVPWWGYAPYAAWMLVPCALHLREERLFR